MMVFLSRNFLVISARFRSLSGGLRAEIAD